MDTLHGVMRTLHPERKSDSAKPADHLSVFREFISHLDRIARQAPKPARAKAPRVVRRKGRR
jgi:TorA maturation chaperone TorD